MRIEQALQRWDADKIGIPDYALESAGKSVQGVYKTVLTGIIERQEKSHWANCSLKIALSEELLY